MEAEELGLTFTIGFVAVTTRGTRSARISRINKNHGDTCSPCLVNDKLLKLIESPVTHLPTHFFRFCIPSKAVGSLPDTCQVFQSKCLTRKKCRLHKLFTDVVIEPAGVSPRLPAHLFERTLCPLRPRFLQGRTMGANTAASRFDTFARVSTPFAIRGYLHNAEVNPKYAVRDNQGRVGNAHRYHQVELAVNKGKVSLALPKGEKPALILAADKGQFQPTINRPDRNLPFICIPVQNAVIIGNRAVRLKRALGTLVQFVSVGYFGNGTDNYLRGQARSGTLGGILAFVQGILLKNLVLPNPCAEAVTNGVCGLHGALQGIRLFARDDQFNLCSKFHYIDIIPAITQAYQGRTNLFGQFLPVLKGTITRVR